MTSNVYRQIAHNWNKGHVGKATAVIAAPLAAFYTPQMLAVDGFIKVGKKIKENYNRMKARSKNPNQEHLSVEQEPLVSHENLKVEVPL